MIDQTYTEFKNALIRFDKEYSRAIDDNVKGSYTRARAELMLIKKMTDAMRVQLLEKYKALPVKGKNKVDEPVVEELSVEDLTV